MSIDEIALKLKEFLKKHDPMTEECHAVYLLVELRKVIDQRELKKTYPLLNFYADWAVHYEKGYLTAEIKKMADKMYAGVEREIVSGGGAMATGPKEFVEFARMSELRSTMTKFLHSEGIGTALVDDNARWTAFVSLLTEVLAHQPILINSPTVKGIHFLPKNRSCAMVFNKPVVGKSSYKHRDT